MLDVNTLYSNDINMMLKYYGVEACTQVIVKEMNNVFSVYGIEVNPRHLLLVADHMTNLGSVQPFSRGAMVNNSSALQKMTYETTLKFMRDAIIRSEFVLELAGDDIFDLCRPSSPHWSPFDRLRCFKRWPFELSWNAAKTSSH